MSCDEDLDKLSEKLNSRRLVQEEDGFQKGFLRPQEQKRPGLDRVNSNAFAVQTHDLMTGPTA